MRNVIVHYHLFKNAGSSIDSILKESFGDRWHSFDPENSSGKYHSVELGDIIESNKEKDAFSSHCIVPPLPSGDFTVHPIVVLRDPISRVMSAYLFEWKKQMGLDSPKGTLTEYIQDKFSKPRANAIEDFQTIRLSVTDVERTAPRFNRHDEQILADAIDFVTSLPTLCLVEEFSSSLQLLKKYFGPIFPEIKFEEREKNKTQDTSIPLYERHENIKTLIGTDTYDELVKRNLLDIKLYSFAKGRFSEMKKRYNLDSPKDFTSSDASSSSLFPSVA